ncbi:hypothetical protein WN944_028596 [Citrus x changshan-huyou]|uniref:16S rRNA (uracil(1498)-N(3))-methyltransferase n=1 Tax=Citrus x changshan-huyou TaxID=2935761 RepID=A0AAP0LR22_9ROSI
MKEEMGKERQYWLLKTEPGEWSWEDQAANGGVTKWDGVKNKQAQKNMKAMRLNELCFFYHSGARSRRVVGVVSVLREWYEESGNGAGAGAVDVKEVGMMRRAVDLKEMKRDQELKGWALFRQPRLSVVNVEKKVWDRVCDLGEGDEFWHMMKVLRLSTNDRVELFNGKGGLIEGCIQRIDRTGLDVVALEDLKLVLPQHTQWNVFAAFGTLKGGRADWLVEKCTELGAQSVTPLLTERSPSISENRMIPSVSSMRGCLKLFVFLLSYILFTVDATLLGQRLHEMVLNPPMKIDGLLPLVSQSKLAFVAIAEATPLVTALSSSRNESSGLIIVGPEGDFTEKEVNKIVEAGATAVGLGPHRLRVETATIALLATLMLCSDSQQMPIP